MMRELADNILDIAQNSKAAGASLVEIDIIVSHAQDTVSLAFIDNGCGMSEDMVRAVCDPFTTTRKTRKVGLGLPLLKMTAQATGGEMSIASKPGEGTTVRVSFGLSHIDRPPMGDVPGVLQTPPALRGGRAAAVALVAKQMAAAGQAVLPEALLPDYHRLSQAERERAERLAAEAAANKQ